MKREIKFRAWIIDENNMIPWHEDFFSDMSVVTSYDSAFPSHNPNVVLMQFTGLTDRNGNGHDFHIWAGIEVIGNIHQNLSLLT